MRWTNWTDGILATYQGRCGFGPRLPLLVISPYAKANYVDHTLTDQTSILKFIEDNWNTGRIGDDSFDEKAGSLAGPSPSRSSMVDNQQSTLTARHWR